MARNTIKKSILTTLIFVIVLYVSIMLSDEWIKINLKPIILIPCLACLFVVWFILLNKIIKKYFSKK